MDKLKTALGLKPDATDDDVLAAVAALQERLGKLETAQREAEADQFVATNSAKVADKAAIKAAYLANPELAKSIILNCKAPEPTVVVNSSAAGTPSFVPPAKAEVLTKLDSLSGTARSQFLRDNAEAINNARLAQNR